MALQDYDPNKGLEHIRAAVKNILPVLKAGEQPAFADVEILEYYVRTMDEWLSKGGYPPAAWDPFSQQPDRSPATVTGRTKIHPVPIQGVPQEET